MIILACGSPRVQDSQVETQRIFSVPIKTPEDV